MHHSQPLYRCGLEEHWRRQIGDLQPNSFARVIGGCEDFIKRLKLDATLEGHDGCVNTVHFNSTGETLVSGSDDKEIVLWNWAVERKRLSYASGHDGNVFQARMMPYSDDRVIISCAADGQVRYGQVLEGGQVETKKLAKHRGRAHKLAVEPGSSRIFYSCGEDGVVRQFDLRTEKTTNMFVCHGFRSHGSKHRRNIVRLNAIVTNPRNSNHFAVGGLDEFARVYDIRRIMRSASEHDDQPVDTFTPKHLLGTGQVHITCVAFSQQEELLVSYNDELIYLFDKEMGLGSNPIDNSSQGTAAGRIDNNVIGPHPKLPEPQVYEGHRNAKTVKGVNFFGPNTEYVVSGSDCGRIFIWKKMGGKLIALMQGDSQVVNCLEPHPHATILATSGIDSAIKVWAPTADRILPLPEDAERVMATNKRRRENRSHISLTPDILRHVLRFRRLQSQSEADNLYVSEAFDEDLDLDLDMDDDEEEEEEEEEMDSHEESSGSEGSANPRDCFIS